VPRWAPPTTPQNIREMCARCAASHTQNPCHFRVVACLPASIQDHSWTHSCSARGRHRMPTEADTCRKFVVPGLQAGGWDSEPHSIREQRTITDGRIVPVGAGFVRKPPKRVDYLLRYTRDFPIAVVEAKPSYKTAAQGLQQAKQYAEMIGLKFAYATNG